MSNQRYEHVALVWASRGFAEWHGGDGNRPFGLAVLIIIPIQIAASDRTAKDQTAREIYREFLSTTIQHPELVETEYCKITDPKARIAYESYVEYLLYTTEQMVETSPEWSEPMGTYLDDHLSYMCSRKEWKASRTVFWTSWRVCRQVAPKCRPAPPIRA